MNTPSGETDALTEPVVIKLESNASSTKADFGISNNSAPLPLNTEPLLNLKLPLNIEPLATEVTINPSIGSTDAVTEPVANIPAATAEAALIASCASVDNATNGISNKFSPLPLYFEPLFN